MTGSQDFVQARDRTLDVSLTSDPARDFPKDMQRHRPQSQQDRLFFDLWGTPRMVTSLWNYDAEGHADQTVLNWLQSATPCDEQTAISEGVEKKWTGWYVPKAHEKHIGTVRDSNL